MRKLFLVIAAAVTPLVASAQRAPIDLFVADLSRCDSSFFRALAANQASLEALSPLVGGVAAKGFAVPDRRHPTRSRVMFKRPVSIQGITVLGYFDEIAEIPNGMSSYSWGYLIANTVSETTAALKPLLWEANRLRADGPVFVRSEVYYYDKPKLGWSAVQTEAGVPERRTVERVMLIEPYDGESAFIRFGCSIQGNVTEPILQELRVDLRP